MAYKYTTGSIHTGDIIFEDDSGHEHGAATYIDFGYDSITLRPAAEETLICASGSVTLGVDAIGVDFRVYSATTNEGILYDASEDELGLLLTTKLKFHDIGGGEEIYASSNGHLEVNAGTTLDMTAPTVDINASTSVTIDTDTLVISSANADDPVVRIKNTANDETGARLQFIKDKGAAGAANDVAGVIEFIADDASQDQVAFAKITALVKVHTNGQEGGELAFEVASHDGEIVPGLILADGDAEDEIDVSIGSGTASITTVAGNLTATSGVSLSEGASLDISTPLLPTTDHTATGLTAQMLAGGEIAALETVCIHTTTGEVVISDADAASTMPVIGIAPAAISDTNTGTILLQGFIRDDTWNWTLGGILYADNTTAGGMTQTAPSGTGDLVQVVGVALSADVVYFNPSLTLIEVA